MDDRADRIRRLTADVARLEDENDSLWAMLDELHASDVSNFHETLQRAHEQLLLERIMRNGPIVEA
jgi:hypothetical protein